MNTSAYTYAKKETVATVSLPIRICMHVHNIARIDPRVLREATALTEAGFTVSIVDIENEPQRPPVEMLHGVSLKHVLMPSWYISTRFPWSLLKAMWMFIRTTLRILCTPADIYHAHDEFALPACYIAARLWRKPLVFDAHELPLAEMPLAEMSRSRRTIHPLLTWLFCAMVPYCSEVIATSSYMALEISKRYSIPQVTVVRNLPPYRIVQKSDRLRQFLGLSSDIRIALYQGNLQLDRRLDVLMRAAAFLEQNIVIVMMGKTYKITQSELEAMIASEGVSDRVKIVPWVPYAELLDWTASADIGLAYFPGDYAPDHENAMLPNKLFEYVMVGLPGLASPLKAIAEVIRTYDVGQVLHSLAPADIGAAINAMLADHDALARMRQNALEAARSEFNWEKETPQLVHLYHRIVSTTQARRGRQKIS